MWYKQTTMMPRLSKTRRRIVVIAAICVLAAVAVALIWALADPLRSSARRQWKDRAIAHIQQRLNDQAWLDRELANLKNAATIRASEGHWVSDELLLARNGDWIICQSVCSKEQSTGVRKDLFIGRGSDGKWYYSTFHFCVGMCVLQMETQPGSLAEFVTSYWLAPFDGKSDDGLNITWNGGPYGQARVQGTSGINP